MSSGQSSSSAEKKDKQVKLIDDDEFEEFTAKDVAFKGHSQDEQVWDENWEHEQQDSEFAREVHRILAEGGYEQKQ